MNNLKYCLVFKCVTDSEYFSMNERCIFLISTFQKIAKICFMVQKGQIGYMCNVLLRANLGMQWSVSANSVEISDLPFIAGSLSALLVPAGAGPKICADDGHVCLLFVLWTYSLTYFKAVLFGMKVKIIIPLLWINFCKYNNFLYIS